jgi:hypothetical protein
MSCLAPRTILVGIAFALAPASPAAIAQGNGPYIQHEPRAMTRVVYFGDAGVSGEYAIEYGKPDWKAEYEKGWDAMTRGKRLRLGKDWWTTLNTFCPLVMEKVEVKPGEYFLALECSDKGEWSLVALDPEPLRKQKFDAFGSEQTKGGTKIPMKHEEVKESAAELSIQFVADPKDSQKQSLQIRFGKHQLSVPVQPKL